MGDIIAHACASRYSSSIASVIWGKCPLPGALQYESMKHSPGMWNFTFHQQLDLPEALIAGRERIYLDHFYQRFIVNGNGIKDEDFDAYVNAYSQPGTMRAGLDCYRVLRCMPGELGVSGAEGEVWGSGVES